MNRRVGAWLMPLIVLCAGVVLLLNTTGVISWSVWGQAWRFWPVLLIGFGLYMLVRNLLRTR